MTLRKPKPDPTKVYVATTSFAMGDRIVVRTGERLRGDHEAVRGMFGAFVEDGTPPSEWPSPVVDVPDHEPEFTRPAPQHDPAEYVICTLAFGDLTRWVKVGERLHQDDELVRRHSHHFARLVPLA